MQVDIQDTLGAAIKIFCRSDHRNRRPRHHPPFLVAATAFFALVTIFFIMAVKPNAWLAVLTITNMVFSSPVASFAAPFSARTRIIRAPRPRWLSSPSLLQRLNASTKQRHSTAYLLPRGGAVTATADSSTAGLLCQLFQCCSTPQGLFNATLVGLAVTIFLTKVAQRVGNTSSSNTQKDKLTAVTSDKPEQIQSLQRRFLPVFWLLRCADWLQGPYFYEVYASKVFQGGVPASMSLVSRLFLTGFASTAVFGPSVGRAADQYGRKKATLAFCIIYGLGALSTKSPLLQVLFLGRILSGIGTSLLFSAPESWLVGEAQSSGKDPEGQYLGETFGLAYAGDSIVAILAGQMAAAAASQRGPTGPFELSTLFLTMGGILAAFLWNENKARMSSTSGGEDGSRSSNESKPSIAEAIKVVQKDPKIMLVGGVQSLFEAAMYIFVLQWPPAVSAAIAKVFGASAATPYGTIFSCFMACCLLGSTLFGQLAKNNVATEHSTTAMLSVATLAMVSATYSLSHVSLAAIVVAFFAFEVCVGMYFPSIGTLRSKYVPDSHRSVIMNLFGIPLNVLVVSVFLSIDKLGVGGALTVSSAALGLATLCMLQLKRVASKESSSR